MAWLAGDAIQCVGWAKPPQMWGGRGAMSPCSQAAFCSNELCGAGAGLQIIEKMLRFIYANVRRWRRRRGARVNLPADKASVHSCAEESGVDRVSWRGEKEGF